MIIKLTVGEMRELMKHDGPFGERGFHQFMAGMCARLDKSSGEIDVDREDEEKIRYYSRRGHKRMLDRIFKRPLDEAWRLRLR